MLAYAMNQYWRGIWGYIYALTRDPHATDDLTQDVFVRAYTHSDQFRNESSYKTWLFAIARNLCSDYHKSAFFRRVLLVDNARIKSINMASSSSSEDEAVQTIENHYLWSAIFQLKQLYREVVILHIREDMTFKQIAIILHIPEVTVRARYRRALEKLRDTLGKVVSDSDI